MKLRLFATAATAALLAGCTTMQDATMDRPAPAATPSAAMPTGTGYFATESTLPFHAPDFTKFTDADLPGQLDQGMAIHQAEVQAIIANPAPPTFDNTIVALEKSGRMLTRAATVLYSLTSADTNDARDKIEADFGPKLAAHSDAINLDPGLFARVKAVYDQRASLGLDAEDAKLLEKTYEGMVHAGANLTPDQKEKVKAINARLAEVTTRFSQSLTEATKAGALKVTSKAALAGLSDAEIAAAAKVAADRNAGAPYVIALQNTTQQPAIATLTDRATRKALFDASWTRSEKGDANDTRALVAEIVNLRAQKAALFGAPDWATYQMWDSMAETPKNALSLLGRMTPPLKAAQLREAAELNAEIKAEGGNFTVKPWDWPLYADHLKKKRFDLNDDEVKPYFEMKRVLEDGVFYAANQLYGLTFKQRTDIPTYNPDMWVYTVYDKDGSELALFYFDPFQRDNKQGGAWMGNFVEQSHLFGDKPAIYNVLNIPKAPTGQPQLVSFDNVETMFHEFGHALHGMFANGRYSSLSGTNVARDFVEFPSQVNELWASDPKVLAHYAKHYQTGAPIPAALVAKLQAAAKFDQGYQFGETVEAALLDMKWHSLSPAAAAAITPPAGVDAFEAKSLDELGLATDLVPPRYRSSYFRHIFGDPSGYSAGYYAYLWTQMLDHDSRHWFLSHGGLTRENGQHFRDTVLSKGGTLDYYAMFRSFTGHDPDPMPLLEDRGLAEPPK